MPVHSVSLLNRASLTRGDQVLLLIFGTTGKHPDNEVLMHLQGYLIATQKTITNEQKAKERALPQKKKKVFCQSIPHRRKIIFLLLLMATAVSGRLND